MYIPTHTRTHTHMFAGRRPLATGRHWQLATATGDWLHILNFAVARSWLFVNWFQCLPTALAAPATDATAIRCHCCCRRQRQRRCRLTQLSSILSFVVCRAHSSQFIVVAHLLCSSPLRAYRTWIALQVQQLAPSRRVVVPEQCHAPEPTPTVTPTSLGWLSFAL